MGAARALPGSGQELPLDPILAADPAVPDVDAAALLGHDVATFHAAYARRTEAGAARAAAAAGSALRGSI
jgi:hypothetical protein